MAADVLVPQFNYISQNILLTAPDGSTHFSQEMQMTEKHVMTGLDNDLPLV